MGFLTEWQLYAQKIEGDAWVGEKLDQSKIQKMSGLLPLQLGLYASRYGLTVGGNQDEQLAQLYELMKSIQKRGEEDDQS